VNVNWAEIVPAFLTAPLALGQQKKPNLIDTSGQTSFRGAAA
jgi:hypothetical protein